MTDTVVVSHSQSATPSRRSHPSRLFTEPRLRIVRSFTQPLRPLHVSIPDKTVRQCIVIGKHGRPPASLCKPQRSAEWHIERHECSAAPHPSEVRAGKLNVARYSKVNPCALKLLDRSIPLFEYRGKFSSKSSREGFRIACSAFTFTFLMAFSTSVMRSRTTASCGALSEDEILDLLQSSRRGLSKLLLFWGHVRSISSAVPFGLQIDASRPLSMSALAIGRILVGGKHSTTKCNRVPFG